MEYIDLRKVGREGLKEIRRQVVWLKKMGKTGKEIKALYYFLIKSFNYPISARDTGNDLVRQRANSIAKSPDNFFQRSKYPVTESTLSNFFPNLFNRVHFRRIWWDIEKDNIIRQI